MAKLFATNFCQCLSGIKVRAMMVTINNNNKMLVVCLPSMVSILLEYADGSSVADKWSIVDHTKIAPRFDQPERSSKSSDRSFKTRSQRQVKFIVKLHIDAEVSFNLHLNCGHSSGDLPALVRFTLSSPLTVATARYGRGPAPCSCGATRWCHRRFPAAWSRATGAPRCTRPRIRSRPAFGWRGLLRALPCRHSTA